MSKKIAVMILLLHKYYDMYTLYLCKFESAYSNEIYQDDGYCATPIFMILLREQRSRS